MRSPLHSPLAKFVDGLHSPWPRDGGSASASPTPRQTAFEPAQRRAGNVALCAARIASGPDVACFRRHRPTTTPRSRRNPVGHSSQIRTAGGTHRRGYAGRPEPRSRGPCGAASCVAPAAHEWANVRGRNESIRCRLGRLARLRFLRVPLRLLWAASFHSWDRGTAWNVKRPRSGRQLVRNGRY